jgi:hypothetical protein
MKTVNRDLLQTSLPDRVDFLRSFVGFTKGAFGFSALLPFPCPTKLTRTAFFRGRRHAQWRGRSHLPSYQVSPRRASCCEGIALGLTFCSPRSVVDGVYTHLFKYSYTKEPFTKRNAGYE